MRWGRKKNSACIAVAVVMLAATARAQTAEPIIAALPAQPVMPQQTLPAGTPVIVMLNEELSTMASHVGDSFSVIVLQDVTANDGTIVIPKGTIGKGEVTFATNKGGFGKPGILGISLRDMDVSGKRIALDGRYREEGKNNNGATAATWFAVGIFSGFIKGKAGVIPKGRELKARTGEDIPVARPAPPAPVTTATP